MSNTQPTEWWQVMQLRPEIAAAGGTDDVRMSLHDAVFGAKGAPSASSPYSDPVNYAAVTHPSAGLIELMARIALRLAGPGSAPQTAVWRLDQAMGGGKSHGLVGLYHLAAHPRRLAGTALGEQVTRTVKEIAGDAKVAGDLDNPVCVVLDCDNATAAVEDFGPAMSLGERFLWRLFDTDYEQYKAFAGHTPNKAKLAEALRSVDRPVLVLVDELMDYVRFVAADDHDAAVKDMAFLRALLDAVNTVERCAAVVVMIDSESDNMAVNEAGADLRREMEDLLRRNARTMPVTSGGEFAEIIQCRLFESPPPEKVVAAAAKAWSTVAGSGSWHTKVFNRLGHGAASGFADRLGRCYPFAPELIDLAENEWSHHAGFQKVRSTIRVFAATVHELAQRAAAGEWSPPLIGSGDLPLDAPQVRDALLHSGLVAEGRTVSNLREVAATDIADPQRSDRGTARSIDNSRGEDLDWAAANPHAAQRAATALFARSLCPRPGGARGTTEAELHAATFVPDGSYTYGDAESVLVTLEPPDGLVSVEVTAGKGKNSPRRWYFETRNTLTMLTRAARQSVPQPERDKAITDRAFVLAGGSSGPFAKVICVDGGPVPDTAAGAKACIDVLKAAGIDNKNETRLVVLDSRWFSLFNGDDSATREALEAAMGLGADAMSVAWASSAVFACAHTASRAQARNVAAEWLACCSVADMASVRDDPDMNSEAVKQQREALDRLDRQVRGCYKHIVYLAPTGEHDRKIDFLRIQQDALTALSGADVWAELRAVSKAAGMDDFNAKMLLVNLRPNDYGRPLREIRDSFWNNPHKPLLPKGGAELADAIHQAVADGEVVLVDDTGIPYKVHGPGDINLADTGIRLQRPGPPPGTPDPADGAASTETPPTGPASSGGAATTDVGAGAAAQPTPTDQPPSAPSAAPGGQHWMANITISADIDTAKGNDQLVQLLRELMVAVDDGHITHINQMSTVTIAADQKTADKLKAAADQAGVQINIKPI
jgi:hypothetical protein